MSCLWEPGLPQPIAILTSDWHLSLKPPLLRAAEPDWLSAQGRVMSEIKSLLDMSRMPVIVAGDMFDRWNASPGATELLNWAMLNVPPCYALPGQHDLPYHNYDDRHKSAFWTLVQADWIAEILPGPNPVGSALYAWGFPWGFPLAPLDREQRRKFNAALHPEGLDLAVIHKYVWHDSHKYPGAAAADEVSQFDLGFDAVVSGDNHQGFLTGRWFNAGTLMRRKADELHLRPQVGILCDDGSVVPYRLDTSQDVYADPDQVEHLLKRAGLDAFDAQAFVEELNVLGTESVDFAETVLRMMNDRDVTAGVRHRILAALESNA